MLDLDRMAEKAEPQARKDFLGVWGILSHYATLDLLTRALAERRSNLVVMDLPWQGLKNALYAEYRTLLLKLFEQGGKAQFTALVGKIDRPTAFNIQHPEAERWARTYAGRLVEGLTRETQQALANAIAEMIRLQIPPEQGARMLRQMLGLTKPSVQAVVRFQNQLRERGFADDYITRKANEYSRRLLNHRARVVARTETLRAMQEGQRQSFSQAVEQGVLIRDRTRRMWATAGDERTCFICAPMDGQLTTLEEPWQTSEGPVQTPTDTHPQCFPAGQLVTASPLVTGAVKRWYSGELVTIETARGYKLSVTPNHPILTAGGWMAAGLLQPADRVVCHPLRESQVLGWPYSDNQQMPARIEEVAGAFGESGGVTTREVPTTTEDFHGDGMEGQVAVVWAHSLLGDGVAAASDQPLPQGVLVGGHIARGQLPRLCNRHAMLAGVDTPPGSVVASGDLRGPSLRFHLPPFEVFGLGLGAGTNTSLQQESADDGSADAEVLRHSILRHTRRVELDDILRVARAPFTGHVYNLQTEDGWYAVSNIITHNCRCSVVLVFPDAQGQFPSRSPRGTDTGQPVTPRTLRPKVRREP